MDNQVIFAAAGHGKTYSLCARAKSAIEDGHKQVVLISYTNEGLHSLEKEYRKQNCGVLDSRVVFKSWYSFLLSEFIKPYQCSLQLTWKKYKKEYPVTFPENYVSSIAFYETDPPKRWYNKNNVQYFVNSHGDVVPDRTSHLALLCNNHSDGKAIARMEQIYSHIFIDELQDYAGWDLELIRTLFESRIQMFCVGDYKQATYRTNNSPKYMQYRDDKIKEYFLTLENKGLCKISYENTTRRFNQEICDFINTIHNDTNSMVIPDLSCDVDNKDNIGVYAIPEAFLSDYCQYYHPIILRYDKRARISFFHDCEVMNYGNSKGATFDRVVIIPVSTVVPFIEQQSKIDSNQTKSKFYVACTRAKTSIVFAMEIAKDVTKFKPVKITINDKEITAYKYSPE